MMSRASWNMGTLPFTLLGIIAIVAVFIITTERQVSPKLQFAEVENGYQLQRAIVKTAKRIVDFVPVGEIEFSQDGVVFKMTAPAIYPWEENKQDEITDRMQHNYNEVLKTVNKEKQKPLGVVEAFGKYYLVVEGKDEKIVYTLTDLYDIGAMSYNFFIMQIRN